MPRTVNGTGQNQLDYELYLWALERHGLQAAYAPLVSQAVAFE